MFGKTTSFDKRLLVASSAVALTIVPITITHSSFMNFSMIVSFSRMLKNSGGASLTGGDDENIFMHELCMTTLYRFYYCVK